MKLGLAVMAPCLMLSPPLTAQFDLLTPVEASRIVERIPPVIEQARKLRCPVITNVSLSDPQQPTIFDVEVRAACRTSSGSSLIDRYRVDRRDGTVTTWGDNPAKVADSESQLLAEQILRQARSRILSTRESQCLALEAARSLPGWGTEGGTTAIALVGTPPFSAKTYFSVTRKIGHPPVELTIFLYVDPTTGHVLNAGTATEVTSASLAQLLAKLIALRSPDLLSDNDFVAIAKMMPRFAAAQHNGCSLNVSDAFMPERAEVQAVCNGSYVEGLGVSISVSQGSVFDSETGAEIDVPEAKLLAQKLSSVLHERRKRLENEVSARCESIGSK